MRQIRHHRDPCDGEKRFFISSSLILLLILGAILMNISGCTYTRYTYSVDDDIPHDESWSIRFFFWPVGSFVPASESPNHTDTAFYYAVAFCELDTTSYSRMGFAIDHVKLTYAGIREPIILPKDKEISHAGEQMGATDVCHNIFYKLFPVPVPRPDTISVEQDITIFYRDSGEIVKHWHEIIKAHLIEKRNWHILEIIEGT